MIRGKNVGEKYQNVGKKYQNVGEKYQNVGEKYQNEELKPALFTVFPVKYPKSIYIKL